MIRVDGRETDALPADDRGLAYGDGLFETLRACNGILPLLDRHLERLFAGLRQLQFPPLPINLVAEELQRAARDFPDGVVKLIVTRGSGGRGYRRPSPVHARRIVQAMQAPQHVAAWRTHGIRVHLCETRLAAPAVLHGLKHLNRLPQVLARAEWDDPEIHEGLMQDDAGNIIEGTMSNLFLVNAGTLQTPAVGPGVRGVMRDFVRELATIAGFECREAPVRLADLHAADEVFMTNSVIGICPVVRIGKQQFATGTITRQLQLRVEQEFRHRA